jgi:hypothetical protein
MGVGRRNVQFLSQIHTDVQGVVQRYENDFMRSDYNATLEMPSIQSPTASTQLKLVKIENAD